MVKTRNLVCFQKRERERENNKRFLVTQRKLKLKTLGDWGCCFVIPNGNQHTKLSRRRRRPNLAARALKSLMNNSGLP